MANAVEHNGKVYILNPEPKGDYAEKVGAPYLNQALTDFGLQAPPSSSSFRPITNEAVAKALAQGNPNLTGVNFRTEFNNIELLEVKLPQGLSAADAVKALNNYDPKTNSYIDKDMAAQLTNRKTEELSAKSANNARDISLASGISPHATVTEQLMVNAAKFDKGQYIVTQQGTSFTVESRVNGHKLNVTAVVDPKFPDRVQLEMSANGYDESATKFKHDVASKLLDGVLKDTKPSTINAAIDFVGEKKIDADITPEKAKKFAEARMESAKGNLVGQNAINEIGIGAMTDQVEKIAPGVRGNSSRPNSAPTGGDTFEDLLQRSGQNDPLHQQHVAADEILRARTLARAEALRAAGHIPEDVSAEEVLKKAGQGASFSQLKETGQKVGEFKAEVRIAMDSMPESRGSLLDRMSEAEKIAERVISDREFKKGITILQQSNPHLAAMSETEIKSLATGLQESGKPVDLANFTEAAEKYRTYIDTHAPASTGDAFRDVLNASDPAIKKAALEHAVDSPNRMGTNPVQPPSLLDEIINKTPHVSASVDVETERGPRTPTAEDRAFVEELLKKGMASQPQVSTQVAPMDTPDPARPTQMTEQQSNSSGRSGPSPISQSGGSSYTGTAQPPQIGPQSISPSGTVMSAVNSGSADTSHLVDQTAPAMGHAEVLGATALKPKLQEDLRPDIRETPVVRQVAAAHSASANDPIHTPQKLTNAPSQAPLTGINTSAPAANEPQVSHSQLQPPAAKPEQAHLEAAKQTAHTQLEDPHYKPASSAPITPAEPSSSGKLLSGGTGQKMDGHTGKASLAIQVASEAARGNYVAATTTAAVAIAEQQGIKFVVKRVPVLGGVITAGMTLWGAGAEAVKGNFKKAGSELVGGAAETVGNIVGFGAGDALREVARKGLMVAGVKEENAPNKSGIRVAAETAYDLGKTIADSAKLKTISKADLAKTIQADPDLPHKLNLRGQEVTLVKAMEDKTFRTAMIKNMEAEAKKNPALDPKVAALKEYGARLDASAPQPSQQAVAKPATATPPSIANPTPSAAEAQYKSLSPTQLAAAIQKDQTLVDTVKIGKNDVLLADALKDKDFRKSFISGLEKAQAGGSDLQEQIAMVKAYETALSKPQQPPSPAATQVAQQQPPKMTATAMI